MEYKNIEELKKVFKDGSFSFPDEIYVNDIRYHISDSYESKLSDMVKRGQNSIWVYGTPFTEAARKINLNTLIVFVWGIVKNSLEIVPYDIRTSSHARVLNNLIEKIDDGNSVRISKERIVGDVVDIVITNIPGTQPMKAKIDTGADVSSLHADKWDINNNQVTFVSKDLSEHELTVPLIEKQAIKLSNGDMQYRPVIELNIKINNIQLTNCMFNLNDRGAMTYPVLVGQNVLEAGGFMVDPSINDPDAPVNEQYEIDWDALLDEINTTEQL